MYGGVPVTFSAGKIMHGLFFLANKITGEFYFLSPSLQWLASNLLIYNAKSKEKRTNFIRVRHRGEKKAWGNEVDPF